MVQDFSSSAITIWHFHDTDAQTGLVRGGAPFPGASRDRHDLNQCSLLKRSFSLQQCQKEGLNHFSSGYIVLNLNYIFLHKNQSLKTLRSSKG